MNLAPRPLSTLQRENLRVPGRPSFNPAMPVKPMDPAVPKDVLAAANQSFDSRYIYQGIFITERYPINWIPVPPGFNKALEQSELDRIVVPWNADVQDKRLLSSHLML